ncbi:hypothetical protein TNCV_3182431 [Trichonephila clavipes]|uniref:Uncharacterized protein n=1 Tax=Trichonephila clavipes TaxID=2585209 RepID=A0A8X6SFR2_TRICX|nr:hypothetical protein TNCV_3182431 [Trichonephila clavipes]
MELHASWTSHGHLHTTTRLQQDYDAPDIFFFFSPIKTWTAVRQPGVCESGVREVPVEWKTNANLTLPAERLSNISRYPGHLLDIACYDSKPLQPEPRRSRLGLRKRDPSYGPRGRSLSRRGQTSMPANLPDHPAQFIVLDVLYPMHFTYLR